MFARTSHSPIEPKLLATRKAHFVDGSLAEGIGDWHLTRSIRAAVAILAQVDDDRLWLLKSQKLRKLSEF
jgi:hypothetical protein